MEERQHRRWVGCLSTALSATLALSMGAAGFAASVSPAFADAGDGTATIRVVREVNANGKWDQALEPGMAGVTVTLTDDSGRSITGVTQADGTVQLAPGVTLSGGRYRIEAQNPKPGVLFPGFASPRPDLSDPTVLSSNVEFVDLSAGKNVEVTTSFWSPEDYCQKNASLVTACQTDYLHPLPGDLSKFRTLISFPYNARSSDQPQRYTDLATNADTGTVDGIGFDRVTGRIFSGAYAKRGAAYGPGGQGAVYVTNPATKQTHLFTTVPNAGTTPHDFSQKADEAFGAVVGKESLGDVDVSADGKDLYVVNLYDRTLYRYDATQSSAAAPKASYAIPNPGCNADSDWRPFGLGIQDGKVYVGGVCTAESTGNKADMRAVVQTFDPAAGRFTGTVMNQPLNFPRGGYPGLACPGEGWYPWKETWPWTQDGLDCTAKWNTELNAHVVQNPEPLLSDILFETNGDMVLGFKDRFVDRYGTQLPSTSTQVGVGAPPTVTTNGGDINRACPGADGMFVLDGNGGCKNNFVFKAQDDPSNLNPQNSNVKEFYPGDVNKKYHQEIGEGGLALSKVETQIAMTAIDPLPSIGGSGVRWLDRTTGASDSENGTDGFQLNTNFGKSGGMGDLEVMCDQAPLQIGNRVWKDTNNNGIQDPGEQPIAGATVNLYDASGTKIGTAVTNQRGEYYFDSTVVKNVSPQNLQYGTTYTVKMDNPGDYAAGGVLNGLVPTQPNAGNNAQIDSSGVPSGGTFPATTVTPQIAGANDHSADFGFTAPVVVPVPPPTPTPPPAPVPVPVPMIDPTVGAIAAAGLLSIGGAFYLRRRTTTGAAM